MRSVVPTQGRCVFHERLEYIYGLLMDRDTLLMTLTWWCNTNHGDVVPSPRDITTSDKTHCTIFYDRKRSIRLVKDQSPISLKSDHCLCHHWAYRSYYLQIIIIFSCKNFVFFVSDNSDLYWWVGNNAYYFPVINSHSKLYRIMLYHKCFSRSCYIKNQLISEADHLNSICCHSE